MENQSNSWGFFFNHDIRIEETACIKIASSPASFLWLKYVKTPRISFPTKIPWPTSESVELTNDPDVTKVYNNTWGKPYQVRYSFSVKSCSLHAICQTWDFHYYVHWRYTKICNVGRSCDDPKNW